MTEDQRTPEPDDRPGHPTKEAALLLVGVVVLLVVLALASSTGRL